MNKKVELDKREQQKQHREHAVAVAGIAGTLVGIAAGFAGAILSVQMQLDHEDETRFQELRLTTYSEFLAASNDIVSTIEVKQARNSFSPDDFNQALERFNARYKTIMLVASPTVYGAAIAHQSRVIAVADGRTTLAGKTRDDLLRGQSALITAMRDELGIEKFERSAGRAKPQQ